MKIYTNKEIILADTKTPVGLYLSLRDLYQKPLLLESSDYNSKNGHYSYICLQPLATISLKENKLRTKIAAEINEEQIDFNGENLIDKLELFNRQFQFTDQDLPFCYAGLFGYTSYDIINYAEDLILKGKVSLNIPDLMYNVYGIVLIFDHSNNSLNIISHAFSEEESKKQMSKIREQIVYSSFSEFGFKTRGSEESSINNEKYKQLVTKAKEHCKLGDVFQLVLSKRFSQAFSGDEFNVYRALKNINPSPYLFYFDLGDFKLFGSSPEAQLIIKGNEAEIHPIAGTYKRTGNDRDDFDKASALLSDVKENAEHMMLVDLARNDLSKYCNTVIVDVLKQLQFYSHVIHLVSKVKGTIKNIYTPFELLFGTFPAGTLSGAPKYKAMQLIDKYETVAREFYGGCVGFISHDNQLNHAIMIRTFLSKNNTLYYQAGAGITVSSNEENELSEVNNKVSALKKAIQQAEKFNNIVTVNHNAVANAK